MNQKNLKQLQKKINHAQATLEQTGELTFVKDDREIQIVSVEFEGAIGWKVGSQIYSDPSKAIEAVLYGSLQHGSGQVGNCLCERCRTF